MGVAAGMEPESVGRQVVLGVRGANVGVVFGSRIWGATNWGDGVVMSALGVTNPREPQLVGGTGRGKIWVERGWGNNGRGGSLKSPSLGFFVEFVSTVAVMGTRHFGLRGTENGLFTEGKGGEEAVAGGFLAVVPGNGCRVRRCDRRETGWVDDVAPGGCPESLATSRGSRSRLSASLDCTARAAMKSSTRTNDCRRPCAGFCGDCSVPFVNPNIVARDAFPSNSSCS